MKFLCVPCDSPMRLQATEESEPGSLAVVYACPECGYEMAMLTNSQETQMVRSLGVRIGPAVAGAVAGESPAAGKCPFSAILGEGAKSATAATNGADETIPAWTAEALARLDAIPELVRPMARAGVERVAREQGHRVIDETVLAAARTRFGM